MTYQQMAAVRGYEFRQFRMTDDERRARVERERERRQARIEATARRMAQVEAH